MSEEYRKRGEDAEETSARCSPLTCRQTQLPFAVPSAMSRSAIGPWPWPSETILRLSPGV